MDFIRKDVVGSAVLLCKPGIGDKSVTDNKTSDGLIRDCDRFELIAAIDERNVGVDIGVAFNGTPIGAPTFANVPQMLAAGIKPCFAIVGTAVEAGRIEADMLQHVRHCLLAGISVVNGNHTKLSDIPELAEAAERSGAEIIDFRQTRRSQDYKYWDPAILRVTSTVLGVLGVDAYAGKRTTETRLFKALREAKVNTGAIYTGPTGWLQTHPDNLYWCPADSVPSDFVTAEIMSEVIRCHSEKRPEVIMLAGQGSLLDLRAPFGSELLLNMARLKSGVVLQVIPGRTYFDGCEKYDDREVFRIPLIEEYIHLIGLYGCKVIALTLNGSGMTFEEQLEWQRLAESRYQLPVIRPLDDADLGRLVSLVIDRARQ